MKKKLISMMLSGAMIFQNTSSLSAMNILNYNARRFLSLNDVSNIFHDICTTTRKIQKDFRYNPDSIIKSIRNFVVDSKNLDEFFERSRCFPFIYSEYVLSIACEVSSPNEERLNLIRNSNREYINEILKVKNELLEFIGYCDIVRMSDDFESRVKRFSVLDINYKIIEEKTKGNSQINTLYRIILKILKLFRENPEAVIQKMRELANPERILLANKILEGIFVPAYFLGPDIGDIFIRIYFSENCIDSSIKGFEKLPTLILGSTVLDMNTILHEIKNSITESSESYELNKC